MCSDPLDPGGEVPGCSVGCTLDMSHISPFRVAAALNVHTLREFSELKTAFSSGCVLGAAFLCCFFRFFFLRTHVACSKYEATLPHLPLCQE